MADLSSYINIAANTVTSNSAVSTTGNVSAASISVAGNVTAGNITANNIGNIASINLNGNASTVLYGNGVFAAVAGGGTYGDSNVNTLLATWGSNTISTTGNITSGYLFGNGSQLTGLPATYGNSNVATFLAAFGSNTVSTTGNVTAGNLITSGASGNIFGANNISANTFSASGNVTAGGLTVNGAGVVTGNLQIQGNLTYNNLTNITTANLVFGLANTTTGISANGAGFVAGNTAEASFLYNYSAQAWNSNIGISAVGNVAGGNIRTTGVISATGNLTAGNVSATNITGTLATASQTNITSVGTLSGLSVTANVTGGNILTGGIVSSTGNIAGAYIIGNGSQLTGVTAYTNANVSTFLAAFGANTISTTGSITSGNVTGGNVLTGGIVSATGNITGGNIRTAGLISSTGNITGGNISATNHTGTTVSVAGNITGGNVLTGGIISSTGNITGGNITTAGQVSATGNITTANSFVGNLTGTTVSVTGNVYAGNVIVNGQPTTYGVVNPDYINAGRITSDQTGAGQGSDIIFNYAPVSSGISLNTSTGVFTLTAGKTYQLFAELSFSNFSDTVNGYEIYDWVDATTNTRLATTGVGAGVGEAINRNTNEFNATSTTLIYTPTTNQTVKVRIVEAAGTVTVRAGIGTKAIIQQINPTIAVQATATGTVATNYAKYTRTASQSVSANSVIVCNVAESSSGTAVSVNTSTGQVTLTAGTYRLRGTVGTIVGSTADSRVGYGWYNETTSAWVGEGAGWSSPGAGNYNTTTSGTAEYVITVASTTVVSLRVTYVLNVSSIGGNAADFGAPYANPWIDIEQIGATFALNALATISTTGNVTVGGNLTVTGNVAGNVATTFEGTWTVPTGNSTQSFTVAASNTYLMWVDCNIPNGILVWNATATLTNTNVPVVGAQYAWVYNGGGTPIDFTSIPNQFIGTANTILRSSVAPSATTNRFDFGINNTSGGNVTVRYGWAQIS